MLSAQSAAGADGGAGTWQGADRYAWSAVLFVMYAFLGAEPQAQVLAALTVCCARRRDRTPEASSSSRAGAFAHPRSRSAGGAPQQTRAWRALRAEDFVGAAKVFYPGLKKQFAARGHAGPIAAGAGVQEVRYRTATSPEVDFGDELERREGNNFLSGPRLPAPSLRLRQEVQDVLDDRQLAEEDKLSQGEGAQRDAQQILGQGVPPDVLVVESAAEARRVVDFLCSEAVHRGRFFACDTEVPTSMLHDALPLLLRYGPRQVADASL